MSKKYKNPQNEEEFNKTARKLLRKLHKRMPNNTHAIVIFGMVGTKYTFMDATTSYEHTAIQLERLIKYIREHYLNHENSSVRKSDVSELPVSEEEAGLSNREVKQEKTDNPLGGSPGSGQTRGEMG